MKKQKDFYTPGDIYEELSRHKDRKDYNTCNLRVAISNLIQTVNEQESRNTRQKTGSGQRVKGL